MRIESLSENNIDDYIDYLKKAMSEEPEMMTAEMVDESGIRDRVKDSFYMNTKSLLAFNDREVVGRIEYHFYGCMQDGYRMCYVDWVYVLPEYRGKGVARELFAAMEKDCQANNINQYYLIRATNPAADRFYHGFADATLSEEPMLRRELSC